MGQYHYVVNLTKKQYLHPHQLGDGLKLWEQLNSEGGTMAALLILLACSNGRGGGDIEPHPLVGAWAGDQIAVVGDYAEDRDLPPQFRASTIYEKCEDGDAYENITDQVKPLVEKACSVAITGEGWRDKTARRAMRPDMIVTLPTDR